MSEPDDADDRPVALVEVSPGGIGFIRTLTINVPDMPANARRQKWVDGS